MLIRADAEGTDTYELNRNLLLTDGARADSVPNLEIETGEIVGAGHASATGRFDDEQLFYLQSRGIPADEARRLVVRGFFADIIDQHRRPGGRRSGCIAAIEAELGSGRRRPSEPAVRPSLRCRDVADDTAVAGRARRRARVPRPERGRGLAVHDVCSHANVSLSEGEVEGQTHRVLAARLALRPASPASPTGLPATQPVPVYPVKIDGDNVLVDPSRLD